MQIREGGALRNIRKHWYQVRKLIWRRLRAYLYTSVRTRNCCRTTIGEMNSQIFAAMSIPDLASLARIRDVRITICEYWRWAVFSRATENTAQVMNITCAYFSYSRRVRPDKIWTITSKNWNLSMFRNFTPCPHRKPSIVLPRFYLVHGSSVLIILAWFITRTGRLESFPPCR